jgi:small ligand-binding sensory domain FIST
MPAMPIESRPMPRGMSCGVLAMSPDAQIAAERACEQVRDSLPGDVDVVVAFVGAPHAPRADVIARTIAGKLAPVALIGVTTNAPIAGAIEAEQGPCLSLLAMRIPGVRAKTFTDDDIPTADTPGEAADTWRDALGAGPEHRCTMLLVDPPTVPIMKLLPSFNAAMHGRAAGASGLSRVDGPVLFGGLASAGHRSGENALFVGERVRRHGFVGLSLSGAFHVDCVVSQGCRPFGPNLIVTKSKANLIFELSGRPVIEVVQEAVHHMSEEAGLDPSEALRGGLFLGVVIDEYKPRFGRNDYLIRNVVGVDTDRACIAVADFPRVGQTVRLHVRDRRTAGEDLALLMDAQRLYDAPFGAMLITCNGRGERLFGVRGHDAATVQRAFAPMRSEDDAGAGSVLESTSPTPIPLAGFQALGEVGPVGGTSFLHSHTACVALFRS